MSFATSRNGHAVAGLLFAAMALCLAGCGSQPSAGKVSGQVVYRSMPVTEGMITFHAKARGLAAEAKLDAEGKFTFAEPLEPGTYAVAVTPPPPEPGDPAKGPTKVKDYPNIPRRVRDVTTSGISREVKEGENDFTAIELKD
jgi:hypothetical protein